MENRSLISKRYLKILMFFILSILLSWLLWLTPLLKSLGIRLSDPLLIFGQFATLGPFLAALIITGMSEGRQGVKRLFRSCWDWRFSHIWLAVIILLPFTVTGLSIAIKNFIQGGQFQWGISPAAIPVTMVMIFFVGGPLEEVGWRGVALPLLLKKVSPIRASLILGTMHGIWHLPLHFIDGTVQSSMPFWEFLLATIVGSIMYTWIYIGTKGSLTAVILYHWLSNTASALFVYWDTDLGRWIFFIIECIAALLIIIIDKKRMLGLYQNRRCEQ